MCKVDGWQTLAANANSRRPGLIEFEHPKMQRNTAVQLCCGMA